VNDKSNGEVETKRRIAAKVEERRRWAELREVYLRCIAIAEQAWEDRLDAAQTVQHDLAVEMRDRVRPDGPVTIPMEWASEIPVPLFTPRDREQFLKEVAATLLISADRRNLGATPEPKAEQETAPEAASGTDEASMDAEAVGLVEAGERAPLSL
jgi:hypothetical protein